MKEFFKNLLYKCNLKQIIKERNDTSELDWHYAIEDELINIWSTNDRGSIIDLFCFDFPKYWWQLVNIYNKIYRGVKNG